MSFASMNLSSADQTQSENRKTALKTYLEDVTILEEEKHDNIQTIKKTNEILTQVESLANELGTDHLNLGESLLDSQVLRATSYLAIRCAESASGNINKYDKHELAEHMSLNPGFWEFKLPYEAPPISYLYGTFDPTPLELRPKAPRKRVERQVAGTLKVPDNIANTDTTTDSTEMVKKVHSFVRKACKTGPLSYFRVALDPTSFSRSIENIYHLSFLARRGLLEVFIDEKTGLPHIKTRPNDQDNTSVENQFIVSIDMKLWRDLIQILDIRKPMMVIEKTDKPKNNQRLI